MATWLPQLPRDLKLHVGRIVGEEPEGSRRFPAPQEVLENPTSPPSHTSTKQGNFALITTFNIHDRREALSQVIRSVQLCLQVAWRGRLHRCRMWRGCPSPTGPGNVADKNSPGMSGSESTSLREGWSQSSPSQWLPWPQAQGWLRGCHHWASAKIMCRCPCLPSGSSVLLG